VILSAEIGFGVQGMGYSMGYRVYFTDKEKCSILIKGEFL